MEGKISKNMFEVGQSVFSKNYIIRFLNFCTKSEQNDSLESRVLESSFCRVMSRFLGFIGLYWVL